MPRIASQSRHNGRSKGMRRNRRPSLLKSLAISVGILYLLTHGAGAAMLHAKPRVTELAPGCVILETIHDDGSAIAQCPDGSYWTLDPDGIGGKRGHAKRHQGTWGPYAGCMVLVRGEWKVRGRHDFARCHPELAANAPYQEQAREQDAGAGRGAIA